MIEFTIVSVALFVSLLLFWRSELLLYHRLVLSHALFLALHQVSLAVAEQSPNQLQINSAIQTQYYLKTILRHRADRPLMSVHNSKGVVKAVSEQPGVKPVEVALPSW